MSDRHRMLVIIWLGICAVMVFVMVILGGAVRLTGSGLSIVDWRPIMGTLPPLNNSAWLRAFELYQQFPEYKFVTTGLSLTEFRFIYLMEYFHRLLGRLIGLVFFVPFLVFLIKQILPATLKFKLWLLLILGACQGVLGWYMVMSGLVDDPHVSQYRLTAHLLLAILIYAWMVRLIFGLLQFDDSESCIFLKNETPGFKWPAIGLFCLVMVMIASGGLMAGTKAGFIYNSFPKMGQYWVPETLWSQLPWWKNLFENPVTIQFIHRWLAVTVLVSVLAFAIQVYRLEPRRNVRWFAILAIFAGVIQVILGISTLLLNVPVPLAIVHQGGALFLLGTIVAIMSYYLPRELR